jgi:hypothetical protein
MSSDRLPHQATARSQIEGHGDDSHTVQDVDNGFHKSWWAWLRELRQALRWLVGRLRWKGGKQQHTHRSRHTPHLHSCSPMKIPRSADTPSPGPSEAPTRSSGGNLLPSSQVSFQPPFRAQRGTQLAAGSSTGSHPTGASSNIFEGLNQANIGGGTFNAAQTIINIHICLPF